MSSKVRSLVCVLVLAQMLAIGLLCWYCHPTIIDMRLFKAQILSAARVIPENERYWVSESTLISNRNARLDALCSVAIGDYRLVGMAGIGLFYPGTPDNGYGYLRWPENTRQSTRMVLGAGDSYHSDYEMLYQQVCYQYAERYNKTIWPFFMRFVCKGA